MPLSYPLRPIEGATITNGGGFTSTTGPLTATVAGQVAHSVFNPANSGVFLYVTSIVVAAAAASTNNVMRGLCGTTIDPNYPTKVTIASNKLTTPIASVANSTYTNAATATNLGTILLPMSLTSNVMQQLLFNDVIYVVPPGTGMIVFFQVQANSWQSTMVWYEAT